MNNSKRVFQILVGNKIFCNICLKDIEDEHSYYFKDEIALNIDKNIDLADMLEFLLGTKTENIYTSGILCQHCFDSAVASYKFLIMCKHNIQQFNDSLALLEGRINSIIKEEEISMKTLFISLKHETKSIIDNRCSAIDLCKESVKCDREEYESIIPSDCFGTLDDVEEKCDVNNSKDKSYKLSVNDIIFDINNISDLKCNICQNNYSNMIRLKEHFVRVHGPKMYTCTDCSRSYGSATLLAEHKYGTHKTFVCSYCGKTYIGKSTFSGHLQIHKMSLICQTCNKAFKHKRTFDYHVKNICNPDRNRINLDEKYVCDYCGKCYKCKKNLRTHIRIQHENGKAHVCPWCNKKFNSISNLSDHIVTHTKEKKFCCDICGGRFVTKASLLYHTRIHTGETPYHCKYCDKKFLSTSRRAEHVRRHHAEPTLECNVCHHKFRSKSCLKRHQKRHYNPSSRLHFSRIISDDKDAPITDDITQI